ncbi:hypothetical protein LCGC14_1390220 [marine sediment metagenome]|uniref:Uncharacterized protein n=1 Tax=marine sediment metagenome TaxID=412755 RepID=A0A0F9K062_9ZZZZ
MKNKDVKQLGIDKGTTIVDVNDFKNFKFLLGKGTRILKWWTMMDALLLNNLEYIKIMSGYSPLTQTSLSHDNGVLTLDRMAIIIADAGVDYGYSYHSPAKNIMYDWKDVPIFLENDYFNIMVSNETGVNITVGVIIVFDKRTKKG